MIVGESEVQGQVKRAYEAALGAGTTGPLTNRLFGAALAAGKRVRAETGIGAGAASVSSVAVDLATEVLGDLAGRPVVIIGAGETSELTAQALAARGVTTIFVANRHAARARSLADRFGGTVLPLDRLPDQLEQADVLLCATASPHPIVERDGLELVMRARGGRPLLVLDIAVPRDVEAACGELEGVRLVDMDGLQRVVATNLRGRGGEAARGEEIVEEEIGRFASWMGSLDVVPTVAALRAHGDAIVAGVVAENAGRWESASARDVARAEAIARAVMARLLHEPTLQLKEHGSHARLELARELFGLADAPEAGRPRSRPPRCASCAAAAGEDRDARQRAGAGAGAVGGRARRRRSGDRRDRDQRRPCGARSTTSASGCWRSRRRSCAATSTSPCTARRTSPSSGLSRSSSSRRRRARTPPMPCAARPRWTRCRRAPRWAPPRCAAARSSSRGAPTSTSSSCAGTSTRGCASWPAARPTRSCSPLRGSSGSGARTRSRRSSTSCPPLGRGRC